jgi:FKBP-type peptidyl-prolyl cis-trans isomerase
MRFRSGVVALGLAAMLGCLDPPDITPVGPPGVELKRMPVIPEGEAATALGEGATQTAKQQPDALTVNAMSLPTPVGETKTTESGLQYSTLKEGTGAEAKPGQVVSIHYVGTFPDGKKFDSSRDHTPPEPLQFKLGTGQVVPGMDEGVAGMRVGERRKLNIPPGLAYGSKGNAKIPPNTPLVFDVELVDAQ